MKISTCVADCYDYIKVLFYCNKMESIISLAFVV